MINPHLATQLRRARRFFARTGQSHLAGQSFVLLGAMADITRPEWMEHEAHNLIRTAFGDPINA